MGKSLWMVIAVLILVISTDCCAAVKKKRFDVQKPESPAVEYQDSSSVVQQGFEAVSSTGGFHFLGWLSDTQKVLREKVSNQIREMKNGNGSAIWKFLAICFIYGLLHALGPGHGKSIVVGFFMARRGRWRQGVALGAGITFAHTLSAVLLLFILYGIFKNTVFPFFELGRDGVEKASYCLLVITGLILFFMGLKDLWRSRGEEGSEANNLKVASWKEIIGMAAITGIVPCPAVALIVLFCLLHSMIALALLGALVICIGMMVTNVSFGIAAVAFRKGVDRGAKESRYTHLIYAILSMAGGAIICMSGLLLFCNLYSGRI